MPPLSGQNVYDIPQQLGRPEEADRCGDGCQCDPEWVAQTLLGRGETACVWKRADWNKAGRQRKL